MKRIADQIWDFNEHEYELIDFKKSSIYTKEFAIVPVIDSFMDKMVDDDSSETELQIDENATSPPIRKMFKSPKQKAVQKVSNQAPGPPKIPSSPSVVSQNEFSFDPPNMPCPSPPVSPTISTPITTQADPPLVQPQVPAHTIPTNQFPISFEWDTDIVTKSVDFFEKFDSNLSDIE